MTPSLVTSIIREKEQKWYWDLTIPGPECYYSKGLLHHNSGKSLIGCIQMLKWAIKYPGDYLIARQFLPELGITTLKTFKEVCPPELIEEERVADKIIKIRTVVPGVFSNVIFRGLDEPDKLRSLNLSGWLIDEANQVSEAAFMLLQGRLRGKGPRKGLLVQNSGGHDWSWKWFVDKQHIANEQVKEQFANICAPSIENIHLPDGYIDTILATWSQERIQREIFADEDGFEGQVYPEFRANVHVVQPFAIPETWPRYIGIDHGFRNASCWLWGAMDYDGVLWVYREFYQNEWLIEEICKKGKGGLPSVVDLMRSGGRAEKISWALIDPSTRARRNERDGAKLSDFDLYVENLPSEFPLGTANNDIGVGIDKIKSYLKVDPQLGPRLRIFNSCTNLISEIASYRWQELSVGQQGRKNERESPVKYNDHSCDAIRYLIMGLPEAPTKEDDIYDKLSYASIEGHLYRQLQDMKEPSTGKDPFGDSE